MYHLVCEQMQHSSTNTLEGLKMSLTIPEIRELMEARLRMKNILFS